ncbi:hypothetical protein P154DRAFT_517113 [Amniculicola lignicola CBS 123094]|uniref:Uncharacterized protein n=1 Tax=Amniculicola lignicola CBS 123094 TaxID=1392246 RepID=A0A6A5X379_9PLEO|nr:hypothetical protein P154DRAFT_517113 [Amniculicola lignicola CBS 123094]
MSSGVTLIDKIAMSTSPLESYAQSIYAASTSTSNQNPKPYNRLPSPPSWYLPQPPSHAFPIPQPHLTEVKPTTTLSHPLLPPSSSSCPLTPSTHT